MLIWRNVKYLNQSDQEVATIMIWSVENHKVGMILIVLYIANVIKEAYLIDFADDSIMTDLLNKENLSDVKIQSN